MLINYSYNSFNLKFGNLQFSVVLQNDRSEIGIVIYYTRTYICTFIRTHENRKCHKIL